MDRNKVKQAISEVRSADAAADRSLQNVIEDAAGIPVPVLPFQGQQIWVYSHGDDELKEPLLLSMIRSVQHGDLSGMRKWAGLRMIISDYKGIWSGFGIRYTTMLLRTGAKDYAVKVVSFRNTCLVLLKTDDMYRLLQHNK